MISVPKGRDSSRGNLALYEGERRSGRCRMQNCICRQRVEAPPPTRDGPACAGRFERFVQRPLAQNATVCRRTGMPVLPRSTVRPDTKTARRRAQSKRRHFPRFHGRYYESAPLRQPRKRTSAPPPFSVLIELAGTHLGLPDELHDGFVGVLQGLPGAEFPDVSAYNPVEEVVGAEF